jgi:hypothetical protein
MRLATVAIALIMTSAPVLAQRPRPFMELSAGTTRGVGGGPYHSRRSMALMVVVGSQPHDDRSFIFAAHFGSWGAHGDDICHAAGPDDCLRQFPLGRVVAITAGGRTLAPSTSVEFLVGPAIIAQVESGPVGTGLLAQVRFGTVPGSYVSPGFVLQGTITRLDGAIVGAFAGGLSVRFW